MNLSTPVSQLSRVGKTTAKKLERIGLNTARDLLHYWPFRYEDFRRIVPINQLQDGQMVTIQGTIELIANRRSLRTRKNITEALVNDPTGSIRVVWFNQPFLTKTLQPGDKIFLSGTIKGGMLGSQLVSPAYEKVSLATQATSTGRLVPVYPLTDGVTQKQLRSLVKQVLPRTKEIPEWLPEEVLQTNNLTSIVEALSGIHFPENEKHLEVATKRLKFDELFLLQLQAEEARLKTLSHAAPSLTFHEAEIRQFVQSLAFALTKTQKIAAWEILQNIAENKPMNRLLSGDVGSGKTVVAALALYNTVLNNYQGVLMAPTEILAAQHYTSLTKLFCGLPVSVGLLTANQAKQYQIASLRSENNQINDKIQNLKKQKEEIISNLKSGEIQIIVGTHALLSAGVDFKNLGLVIVDEQHRFGVEQRKMIKEKGSGVHFLSMTATPIPRSLALMLYGDLDISIISELPPGRKPIFTRLVEPAKREKAYQFIHEQVKQGRQVFVVCPLIEAGKPDLHLTSSSVEEEGVKPSPPQRRGQGEVSDKKSVLSEYEKLSKTIFPDLRVGYLHGKLKGTEKEKIMDTFKNGELDILVSTSVIEVGVNIPNATVMMIEGADKFGLAQLHQFRGRVGRSDFQSYCFLFTDSESYKTLDRLKYFEAHHDGFKLAEKDLEIRGPGEVYGTEQSGMMQLRLAKLTDRELVKLARATAKKIAPQVERYPKLKDKLVEWEKVVHLE